MGKMTQDGNTVKVEMSMDELIRQTLKVVYKYVNLNEPEPQVLDITTLTLKQIITQTVWRVVGEKRRKFPKDFYSASVKIEEGQIKIEYITTP